MLNSILQNWRAGRCFQNYRIRHIIYKLSLSINEIRLTCIICNNVIIISTLATLNNLTSTEKPQPSSLTLSEINPKIIFKYNPEGKRDPGRPKKREIDRAVKLSNRGT
jgi:hypothetical protein